MNRAETEDGSYASARNRKLLAEWAAKAGENEYAELALNPCQTTAFGFFTDDHLPGASVMGRSESIPRFHLAAGYLLPSVVGARAAT